MRPYDEELFPDELVTLPIEDVIDLHAFRPADVKSVVEEYLRECWLRGFREVRIIHGRGIGVQREMVHALLRKSAFVKSFALAPADAGGWGATVVVLVPHESAVIERN